MNADDARRLLSVYATGSLTEAEKTALFQAALEDQDLFDELAAEHSVKVVLDEPGARERLLVALEPPRAKLAWLPWAAAAAMLAVLVSFVFLKETRPPASQEVAQVTKPSEPSAPAPPRVPAPARVAEPSVATRPAAPPKALSKKAAPESVRQSADQAPAPKPQAETGAVQGFAAADKVAEPAVSLRARNEAAPIAVGFGFSYTVLVDGSLQITPAEPGYLTVIAGNRVIFPSNPVPAFAPVTIAIPADTPGLIIGFSRAPGVTGTPVRRDTLTGRESDQDPPNGRILIQLSLKPATQ